MDDKELTKKNHKMYYYDPRALDNILSLAGKGTPPDIFFDDEEEYNNEEIQKLNEKELNNLAIILKEYMRLGSREQQVIAINIIYPGTRTTYIKKLLNIQQNDIYVIYQNILKSWEYWSNIISIEKKKL